MQDENVKQSGVPDDLRKRAEELQKNRPSSTQSLSPREIQALLHELQVHQIELEMQNEDLRRTQQELAASRDKYADLYDFSPMGYFSLDKAGSILEANLSGSVLLGLERRFLIGKPFSSFVAKDDLDILHRYRKSISETNEKQTCELIITRKDGSKFFSELNGCCFRDRNGNFTQCRFAMTDITQRKNLEEQLHQSKKMEALGQFAGGVAHNINNRLQAIVGNLSLVKISPPENQPALILDAMEGAKKAASIVRQILDFSRKSIMFSEPLCINRVVNDVLSQLRKSINDRIEFEVFTESNLPLVQVDRKQIHSVLMNLCLNACDAIRPILDGKVHPERLEDKFVCIIRTESTRIDPAYLQDRPGTKIGKYVVLSVSDNGCGMDKDTQSHIFEPFFTTKGLATGTGMGLAGAYGIVKHHEGWMEYTSKFGTGTTFTVYLPIAEGESKYREKM